MCQAPISGLLGSHLIFTQPFKVDCHPPHFVDENIEARKDYVTGPKITAIDWETRISVPYVMGLSGRLTQRWYIRAPCPTGPAVGLQLLECCLPSGGGELSVHFPLAYDQEVN